MLTAIPRLDEFSDFSGPVERVNDLGVAAFLAAHRHDYYPCEKNKNVLLGWLGARGPVPLTRKNLEIALSQVADRLEPAPAKPAPEPDRSRGVIQSISDRIMEYVPSTTEAEELAKLRDDPSQSDGVRKRNDAKLKSLAERQRIALRKGAR